MYKFGSIRGDWFSYIRKLKTRIILVNLYFIFLYKNFKFGILVFVFLLVFSRI